MKITKRQLRRIIAEEYGNVVTGRERGMSVSAVPTAGMTGLEVGDIVYLTNDAYMDADIYKYGTDYPPVRVTQVGKHKDLLGMDHKTFFGDRGMRPSDYDFAADVGEELAFVGEYQTAPGLDTEDLVFPVSAIDQEYTRRGPKEPWPWEGYDEPVAYAGGGNFNEGRRLVEYSEYASYEDLRDYMDDIADMLETAANKYAASGAFLDQEKEAGVLRAGPLKRAINDLLRLALDIERNVGAAAQQSASKRGR